MTNLFLIYYQKYITFKIYLLEIIFLFLIWPLCWYQILLINYNYRVSNLDNDHKKRRLSRVIKFSSVSSEENNLDFVDSRLNQYRKPVSSKYNPLLRIINVEYSCQEHIYKQIIYINFNNYLWCFTFNYLLTTFVYIIYCTSYIMMFNVRKLFLLE